MARADARDILRGRNLRRAEFPHDRLPVCPPQSSLRAAVLPTGASDREPGVFRAFHEDADSVHLAEDTLGPGNR